MSDLKQAAFIKVRAGVRYWEDADVNGVDDDDGTLIPLRVRDSWCPTIRIADGVILDWPAGTIARIHYKVCDDGDYELLDANRAVVATRDGYVPDIMCPASQGFGDYIIMDVDEGGRIAKWKPTALDDGEWNLVER